jgi:short/branched chain acyl-CoA dehydrogenase
MSFTSSIIVIEELAKVDPSVSVMVDVQNTLVGIPIRKWGSDTQKKKYLPSIAKGTLGSFALRYRFLSPPFVFPENSGLILILFSEWTSGSDAFALKTTATKDSKGNYVLSEVPFVVKAQLNAHIHFKKWH